MSLVGKAYAVCLGLAVVGLGAGGARAAGDEQRIVLPAEVTPDHYDLAIVPDAKALSFKGKVRIDVTVHQATSRITLNAADLVIDHAAVSGEAAAPAIAYDEAHETASFTLAHALKPGHYSLSLDYHGKIFQQASGLFALDYKTASGTSRALFTQFENSDARRFVPSWDEPGRKATFTLTATVPTEQMALSNMPIAQTTPAGPGLQTVRFAETPKMSSYLLFFGLGDFERAHRDVGGVDVGVVVKRGDTASAAFALEAAAEILPYYNDYFGKPYPLPKLDLIAGPGSSQFFGAMENWGAIFYFERDLLIDPRISTEADLQNVYITVAHEMAHQWFGDLVTMAWWDDLWLNEGFASWMENKVTDHFHPDWRPWLQAMDSREQAMQVDAQDGTHPIITPIHDVLQASGAFDDITYEKGAAVIRMLEAYVGEDAFRAGVRRYIADHAYGNTTTDDLWREIDPISGGRPITDIAHDFTLQAGVPLIRQGATACSNGQDQLSLSQGRYALDDSGRAATTWRTPVTAATIGGLNSRAVVSGPAATTLSLNGCAPAILNLGQTGYFRSLYSPAGIAALTGRFSDLTPADQLGLLNDTRALGLAGQSPVADFLNLTVQLDSRTNPLVWTRVADDFRSLDRLYDGLPGQARYRAFARGVLARGLARIGWDREPGEAPNYSLMRSSLIGALGQLGDPAVVAEAGRRFEMVMADPASVSAMTRRTVMAIVALHAKPSEWAQLHAMAQTARTELERHDDYVLLGAAEDPALAQNALDLALSGEPPPTTAPAIIREVSRRHPALALDFVAAHWVQVSGLLEPETRPSFAPRLVDGSPDKALIDKLNTFADAHIPANARQDQRKAVASIRYLASVRDARTPEVDHWLTAGR